MARAANALRLAQRSEDRQSEHRWLPPETPNALDADLSFLGMAPGTELLISEINAAIAKSRLFGAVPGALRYSPAMLGLIIAGVLKGNPAPQVLSSPTPSVAVSAQKISASVKTAPASKRDPKRVRVRAAHASL